MDQNTTSATTWTFLENLKEGVVLISPGGAVQYANSAAKSLLGLDFSTSFFNDLSQVIASEEKRQSLLKPPADIQVRNIDGRLLKIQAVPNLNSVEDLIQLIISPLDPTSDQEGIDYLSTLACINKEPKFEYKLQSIVESLQATGWNQVFLSIQENDYQSSKLIAAGIDHEAKKRQTQKLFSSKNWKKLFTNQNTTQSGDAGFGFIFADNNLTLDNRALTMVDHKTVSFDPETWLLKEQFFIPLHDRHLQTIGVLGLSHPKKDLRPNSGTLQTIELFAQFAASIIENKQLVQETLTRSREFKTLLEANQAISGNLDINTVITLMGKHMRRAIQADGYTIYRWLENSNQLSVLQDYAHPKSFDGLQPATLTKESILPLAVASPIYTVIETKEPQVFSFNKPNDTDDQPQPIWLKEDENYISVILPIILSAEMFGIIALVIRDRERNINTRDLQLLSALSNQMTTVLETALIFEDTYERERFYNALGRVSLAINYTLDKPALLGLICQESLPIFNVDDAFLWQRNNDHFIGVAAQGKGDSSFADLSVPLSDNEAFVNLVFRRGESFFLNHVNQSHLRVPDKETIQAVMGIPLEQDGEIIGIMVLVDRNNPDRFSNKDLTQAINFGVQVAIALQNAKLFEELRRFNEDLDLRVAERTHALNEESSRVKILLRISSELAASLDQDRVLNQALNLVNEVVNATHGVIMLINQETDELVFRAALGMNRTGLFRETPSGIMRHEGLAGWMIKNRSAVIVHDTYEDPRWIHLPKSRHYRSALGVPLISNEEVIGVLMLFHTETAAFTMQQLDLVEAAAIQVANAINNANLYDLIRDQAERLGSMLRAEQIEAAKNQAILESIADGVLVADDSSRIILANLPVSAILGIPPDQLIGKSINELLGLYGHTGDQWLNIIEEWATNAEHTKQWTYLADQLSIEDKIVSVHLSPVLAGRQYFGTVSIFRDITKEVEVDNLKSEFVSTVSHELRTPMTSIKGYADLLLMGAAGKVSNAQDRYLQVIKNNADRLHMLVNDLLDISRIETDKTELDLRPLDIAQIIEQVVEGHLHGRIQHVQKQINIFSEMPPSLPLVQADSARVLQILTNLLDNALNYTPEGGEIRITAKPLDDFVSISIVDTGIGIPESNLDKIFERFFRSESAEVQNVPGTGLGLAIVHSLIDMHGGNLTVESEINKGSNFTFTLPVVIKNSESERVKG